MKRVRIIEFHAHLDACSDCARAPYCALGQALVETIDAHTRLWTKKKRGPVVADVAHPWRNTKQREKTPTSESDEIE